jgi:hypothetical protein
MSASFTSQFYRINANNTAIAISATGTGTPTEEIAKFVVKTGTIAFSSGSATVTGTATTFNSDPDFAAGKTLVYLEPISNAWKLVGTIESIDSATQITLVENAANTDTGVSCFPTGVLANGNDDFYVRFTPNLLSSGQILELPDLTGMVDPINSPWTDTDFFSLTQFSDIGDINAEANPQVNVNVRLVSWSNFAVSTSNSANWFTTTGNFPTYAWAKAFPNGSQPIELSESTLFTLLCRGVLPSVQFTANQSRSLGETYGWK